MFLSLLITGPKSPERNFDTYMQPLIEEFKHLWNVGVETYDVSKKQNFIMKTTILWTVSDFLAYGMLSGWMTARRLACPYCMEKTKSFRLKYGKNCSWFDFHRQILPHNHVFRGNKIAFYKNKVQESDPPPLLQGDQVWDRVSKLPKLLIIVVNLVCMEFLTIALNKVYFGNFHIGGSCCFITT